MGEGGREGGREGGTQREGGREGGKQREGGREGGREGRREGLREREGGRDREIKQFLVLCVISMCYNLKASSYEQSGYEPSKVWE